MRLNSSPRYVAFSDEAQHNVGRVRGVGALSLRAGDVARLSAEAESLIRDSGISECKWELVRSARQSFAAQKLLGWALDRALDAQLWIDVLTWSPEDGLPEEAAPALTRLRAMYARLLDDVIGSREPDGAWRIFPDEHQALNWTQTVAQMACRDRIEGITPARSHATPLIQVADLFVGLAVFSRASFDAYERWRSFPDDERNVLGGRFAAPQHFPASVRYRCKLLDDFYTTCVRRLPGISLRTRGGLHTHGAGAPIRFQ